MSCNIRNYYWPHFYKQKNNQCVEASFFWLSKPLLANGKLGKALHEKLGKDKDYTTFSENEHIFDGWHYRSFNYEQYTDGFNKAAKRWLLTYNK